MVFFSCKLQRFEKVVEEGWIKAMDEEMVMIEKNKTWDLVDPPQRKKVIGDVKRVRERK